MTPREGCLASGKWRIEIACDAGHHRQLDVLVGYSVDEALIPLVLALSKTFNSAIPRGVTHPPWTAELSLGFYA